LSDQSKSMRLDMALVKRGLAPTRARARDLISRGFVTVDGRLKVKVAASVTAQNMINLSKDAPLYVSRGAEKLTAALNAFKFCPAGCICLDVGASTGGFTEVLLQQGAQRVIAVDVGHGQLHETLRKRPEVKSLEGTDARQLRLEKIGGPADAIVIDVSFISLIKVLPFILPLADVRCWLVALVKPQFEVGPTGIGKGGVVTDAAAREAALANIIEWLVSQKNWRISGSLVSPLLGGSGNQEYLVGAYRHD